MIDWNGSSAIGQSVTTPFWGKCEVAIHTLGNGIWESSGTPENSKRNFRGQNTSHWSVLYTVEKVLKFRCPKWLVWFKEWSGVKLAVWLPTTESWESTWSRCVQVECNTTLESSQGELQVCFRPHPNWRLGREAMNAQSPRSPNWDNFGTPLWESWEKVPFGCKCGCETHIILHGGRWWLPPSPGCGESSESKVTRGLSQHQECSKWVLTNLLVGFGCRTE